MRMRARSDAAARVVLAAAGVLLVLRFAGAAEAAPPEVRNLTLSPASGMDAVGSIHAVTATATDASGSRVNGVKVRFAVTGAHTLGGTATTGESVFQYTGVRSGEDLISAYADSDGDGTRGSGEPSARAGEVWYSFPSRGAFVVGDVDLSEGRRVTFWGAQWWKDNKPSGGTGPAGFKGFANGLSHVPPRCGETWTSRPGNSSSPPQPPLPAFMGVLVTTMVEKSGPDISGDTAQIVVVRTDKGYDANPGHPGYGTVTGVICPAQRPPSHPDISVAKTADRDVAAMNETITYTYVVSNTGDVELHDVSLTDDKLGDIPVPSTLSPGASATATATKTAGESDLPGPIVNEATARGTPPAGPEVKSSASESVSLTSRPQIGVMKTANLSSASVDDTITYTYVVTNTGDVTLTNVTLTDDKIPGAVALGTTTLAPGTGTSGTATAKVEESDLCGPLVNVATATGTPTSGPDVSATATASVTLTTSPEIRLTKVPDRTSAGIDDTIIYTYTVTNTGNVTLTNVNVTDDKIPGPIALGTTTLAPTESTSGTAGYTVAETDLPGPLENTGTATGTPRCTPDARDSATASVPLTSQPSIALAKRADTAEAGVDTPVTYIYEATNTGDVTLDEVTVHDTTLGQNISVGTLAPGASGGGTLEHTVVASDLPGPLTNTATANGKPRPGGADVESAPATASVGLRAISLTKRADRTEAAVDDVVTYSYVVTNAGSVGLHDVTLDDDETGAVTLGSPTLAPGSSTGGTATHTVTASDLPGPIVNVATAHGTSPALVDVSAQASASVDLRAISLTKTPDRATASVGETVTYTFVVSNPGSVALHDVSVDDQRTDQSAPVVNVLTGGSLAPGGSITTTRAVTVVQGDLPGPITDTATSSGLSPSGAAVHANASASVALRGLTVHKTVMLPDDPAIYDCDNPDPTDPADPCATVVESQVLTYTVTFTNTGSTTLAVTLTDVEHGDVTGDSTVPTADMTCKLNGTTTVTPVDATLGPVETIVCTYTRKVDNGPGQDVEQVVNNHASVEGSADGGAVTASDDTWVHVGPSIAG